MGTNRRRRRHIVAASAAAAVIATSLVIPQAAVASPGSSDDVLVLTLNPDGLSVADFSEAIADYDIFDSDSDTVSILGDESTAEALKSAGVEVVGTTTYGEAIDDGQRFAVPAAPGRLRAAPARNYPVPERLGDKTYQTYYGGYRTLAAQEEFQHDLASAYPDLVELVDYGNSWLKTQGRGGHDLYVLRITAGADTDGDWQDHQNQKPRFYLTAQTHAREIVTSEAAWRYVTELLDGYGTNGDITNILDTTEVWVALVHNPDGTEIVNTALSDPDLRYSAAGDANPVNQSQAWQRGNLNDTLWTPGTAWSSSQPGVDLNRNYSTAWGGASTSSNPGSTTYKGEAPNSEPEVYYQEALLRSLFGSYKVGTTNAAPADRQGSFINLHTNGAVIVNPYAYDAQAPVPNLDAIRAYAYRQSFFTGYPTGAAGEILYSNAGNDIDWVYDELGIPATTHEIGGTPGGFFPNYARVDGLYASDSPAWFYAARTAGAPYQLSFGPSVQNWVSAYDSNGDVTISGTASDNQYGNNTTGGTPDRRPATQNIVAAEAVIGDLGNPVVAATPLEITSTGVTATFSGTVAVPATATTVRQNVHVRTQDASGTWGPWYSAFLAPAAATNNNGHENIIVEVNPGVLSLSVPVQNTVVLDAVNLTGRDQTTTGNLVPVTVSNGRGTAAGWTLSGRASDFTSDANTVIPGSNLGWSPTASFVPSAYAGGTVSTVTAGATIAPAQQGTGLSVSRTLASAPSNASGGQFTAGGELTLGIPSTARAGTYSSILTLTLI
ncbi:MAG: hypothetical protein LBU50_06820 [Cellulomonas sp.]|jgi:hypothetical protein|nr:hypothetical protein [Cellulomonas sp.]